MGKAKAVKKPSSPLKISTSLFRRKSKNSTGQVDKESVPSSSGKGKGAGKVLKNKSGDKGKVVNKAGSKQPLHTTSSASSSPTSNSNTPTSKQQKKKTAAISTTTNTKKGSEGNLTQGKNKGGTKKAAGKASVVKGKPSKSDTTSKSKTAVRNKEKEKSPSPKPVKSNSSGSSSSSSSNSSVTEAEKISTRKRSKSDADSPPSPVQHKMAKSEEGESSSSSKKTPQKNKKGSKTNATTSTTAAKKVTKKAAISVVASKKKKPPVKVEKPSTSTKSKTKSSQKGLQQEKSKNKPVKKQNSDKNKGGSKSTGSKSKVKPRPKIKLKRMASLNAKAILEASFSFEPQEKKQRSPAPTSISIATKVKNMDDGVGASATTSGKDVGVGSSSYGKPIIGSSLTQKGNDDIVKSISVSTSTSPPPPPPSSFTSSPSPGKLPGERKRKSSETPNRRESTTSNKSGSSKTQSSPKDALNYHISSGGGGGSNSKTGSRRNSTAVSDSTLGATGKMSKKNKKESPTPKKKTKVSTTSTSTTTSSATSPLLSSEFYPEERQKKSKHKHKKEKSRCVDSGTNTYTGTAEAKNQDSGIQVEHTSHQSQTNIKLKSTGCQAKEKKSSTPVAHFGTIYQPAGPLIEPHKAPGSVPAGLLPETVKLPPDLKVTYQTHPPKSNAPTVSHSSSSKASKKHASSSSSSMSSQHQTQKSDKTGQILHQPYKTSLPSSSMSRPIQSNYPGISYVNTATGSPLLSSSSILSQQQSAAVVQQQHQQLASGSGLNMSSHHHSISSSGSASSVGLSQTPSVSSGAPSAGGLFYSSSSGFAPHHSPFAPCKYPVVPPDVYRTNSPYPNSFLYPPATSQPSQSYFMTPFYTPPLTPNSTPVVSSGLGSLVSGNQPRPMSLTAHHHPGIAAASFYHPQSGPPQPSALHHPSNYLVASPHHHSIQPAPAAPGHAGLFPNPCTRPACPCPTESCQLSSTSNNKQQQQQQCVSSVSLPVPEVGAKQHKSQQALVSVTATRPSRQLHNKDVSLHPPICTTPAVAADPPVTIQLLNSNVDIQQTQARQLESAKTFTEQYSLPDDITITPIIVANPNNTKTLVLMNTSISVVNNSTSSSITNNSSCVSPSRLTQCNSLLLKKKEKDIVHVIDPRSGQKTTIAKHISNKNLLACKINKNVKSIGANKNSGQSPALTVSRLNPNINKIGSVGVGKLNPDLDVIVINNNGRTINDITENVKLIKDQANKQVNKTIGLQLSINTNKSNKKLATPTTNPVNYGNPKIKVKKGQLVRGALTHNDNNSPRKIAPKRTEKSNEKFAVPFQSTQFNYSLPPGISISAGVGTNLNVTNTLNNITSMQNQSLNLSVRPMTVQNIQKSDVQNSKLQQSYQLATAIKASKAKKRISLNECIDGLQKKRLKLLEDHNFIVNANGNLVGDLVNGNVILPFTNGKARNAMTSPFNKGVIRGLMIKDTATSARVRDPELNLGSTVIKSSDAVVAVSAVVLDHENYHLTTRASRAAATSKFIKNGLKRGKFQQSRRSFIQTSVAPAKKIVNPVVTTTNKVKIKSLEKGSFLNTRNTRSAAANAKIRTRLSAKSKFSGGNPTDHGNSRSRSRLMRKGNQIIGPNNRKSESDCSSTCTSRSSSAVRIISGNFSNGKVEKEKVSKFPTQAFINAVADLYQYRRNVMLRVPRAGVGVFPSASSVKLNHSGSSSSAVSRGSLSPMLDKATTQLSPGIQNVIQEHKTAFEANSPLCNSPVSPEVTNKLMVVGSMAANAAKKRALVKPLSPASVNGALLQLSAARRIPKWSNGWRFEGEPYDAKVFVNNDDQSVLRRCYPAMRHESGDVIQTRDCVLLKSGSRKNDLPYIAKIAALWENPCDGEMMFSLLWYYRPEHTEMGRTREDMTDEIFASKHIDVNSVATIDDRCYVLTFNEYCRYRKRLKQLEEGLPNKPLISLMGSSMVNNNAAGNIANAVWSGKCAEQNKASSPGKISPEVVFFCRKVYDFRQKRIMKNPS